MILKPWDERSQSQADILATLYGSGQAQANIKAEYYGLGQAQANILQVYWYSLILSEI